MRPGKDEYFLRMAEVVAQRSTCLRRAVGCVLVDVDGHVLATGYNGVAAGAPHCNEPDPLDEATWDPHRSDYRLSYPHACPAAGADSGTQLEGCEAIHAEQNALLQCRDVREVHTAYVTDGPCVTCVKLLLNTGCAQIIVRRAYAGEGRDLWRRNGLAWTVMSPGHDEPMRRHD